MPWEFNNNTPIYLQLIDKIQMKILSGEYELGSKLPSVRELASEASVNPNTMQKALSELENKYLVYSQRTIGRFITEDKNKIEDLKREIAKEQTIKFLKDMKKIGINIEGSIDIINEVKGEID